MSCYIIYHYNILDAQRIEELGPRSLPILEKYDGELVIGSSVVCLEGSTYTHMVTYRFKNKALAKGFYECEENRELAKLRKEITDGIVVFVPGYDGT